MSSTKSKDYWLSSILKNAPAIAGMAACAGMPAAAHASVIVSNLADTPSGIADNGATLRQLLTLGTQAVAVQTIVVQISPAKAPPGPTADMTASLYTDVSGSPGLSLGTTPSAPVSSGSQLSLTFGSPVDLAAGTDYFIVLNTVNDTPGVAETNSVNTTSAFQAGFGGSAPLLMLEVDGTAATASVPEPASYCFFGLGLAALLAAKARQWIGLRKS